MSVNNGVFTTGEAAKICRVSQQTIIRIFDSGQLKGFRVPGSKFRKIPRQELKRYCRTTGIPFVHPDDDGVANIIVISQDQELTDTLRQELSTGQCFKVTSVASNFDAGIEATSSNPAAVIVDFAIGRPEALQACKSLRENDDLSGVTTVALLPDDGLGFDRSKVDDTFRRPFDAALLAKRIVTLIGG